MRTFPNWMRGSLSPDEVIGNHKMLRWWLLPRNRAFNVYLHKHQDDDDRTPHDHPCDNISIRLGGQMFEHVPDPVSSERDGLLAIISPEAKEVVFYRPGPGTPIMTGHKLPRIQRRRAEDAHRLEMVDCDYPCWTLWIRFRNRRRWGYFEATGWRPAKTARQP